MIVLIDSQLLGWANSNEERIRQEYTDIQYVGVPPNPASDASDYVIASYCIKNNYDLLTSDKGAYTKWLENDIDGVHISIFDTGERTVYRIQKK